MNSFKIFYGASENIIDVTDICFEKFLHKNIIRIPSGELTRSVYFTDPLYGILKSVFIDDGKSINEYQYNYKIIIDISDNTITTFDENLVDQNLAEIHSKLSIKYGNINDELPEQKMAVRYLNGKEKVLEIGGNIGRNSLVIASILENQNNLLTLECDPDIAKQLQENRDLNNYKFNIETSALSCKKLIQNGWNTIPSDILYDGWKWVNTITLSEIKNKYNIEFDTLVLDCEGAFYYILQDIPEILDGINLIIMENDYNNILEKNYIDDVLTKNNFYVDYIEAGGWGPCFKIFYEVWKKF